MWRSQQQQERSNRSILWRDTIIPLKQDIRSKGFLTYGSLTQALEVLSPQPNSTAVKEHEVSEDLAFLAQQLSQVQYQGSSSGRAEVLFCRLLASVLGSRHVRMQPAAANIVCGALRLWADGSAVEEDEAGDTQLQCEALQALVVLLQDNLSQVADHERAAVLAVLLALGHPAPTSPTSSAGSKAVQHAAPTEVQRLALAALGSCFPTKPSASLLSGDEVGSILRCSVDALAAATCGRPREDMHHSRFFAILMRTLNAAVSESKRGWVPHTAAIVEGLMKLALYGVPSSPATSTSSSSSSQAQHASPSAPSASAQAAESGAGGGAGGGGRRYMPPHMRSSASGTPASPGASAPAGAYVPPSRRVSSSSKTPLQLDVKDAEGPADRFKSSKVRLGLLQCLQSMAKADSRALQPHWTTLMPLQQPLHPRPSSGHLLAMTLHDPISKLRSMAAATISCVLEGPPQRAYLAVAEARSMTPTAHTAVRGFTTLSVSLGRLVLALHEGLLHAVECESNLAVLSVQLRALCVLLSAAPYERLPGDLLPRLVQVLRARWHAFGPSAPSSPVSTPGGIAPTYSLSVQPSAPPEQSSIHAAYLACLAEALSTKQPVAGLQTYLSSTAGSTAGQGLQPQGAAQGAQSDASSQNLCVDVHTQGAGHQLVCADLVVELLDAAGSRHAVVRIEALAALRGLASNYAFAFSDAGAWQSICSLVQVNLNDSLGSARTSPRRSSSSQAVAGAGAVSTGSSAGGTAAASASTSAEDKAAQHAVQVVGSLLVALCQRCGISVEVPAEGGELPEVGSPAGVRHHPEAGSSSSSSMGAAGRGAGAHEVSRSASEASPGLDELVKYWTEGIALLVPTATSHASYMVRSAAFTALSGLPEVVAWKLPAGAYSSLVLLLAAAAERDAAAAARATACKVLGALCAQEWVLGQHSGHESGVAGRVVAALAAALRDTTLSVRIAACWAIANLSDSLRRTYQRPPITNTDVQQHAEVRAGSSFQQQEKHADHDAASAHVHMIAMLATSALGAVHDADKVRANGVRAVGALLSFIAPSVPSGLAACATLDLHAWLDGAVTSLQSCMTTGNMKVQWNACYAAQALLSNEGLLRSDPRLSARVPSLLLLLVMLVRDSTNFKIRTHAAAALSSLPSRAAYGDVYVDALLVVCSALDGLQTGGSITSAGSNTAPLSSAPASSAANSKAEVEVEVQEGSGTAAAAAAGVDKFPNYRYAASLSKQLSATLFHLLALADPGDYSRLREPLLQRRADMLQRVLWSAAEAELRASGRWGSLMLAAAAAAAGQLDGAWWAQAAGGRAAGCSSQDAGAAASHQLPEDLFADETSGARHGGSGSVGTESSLPSNAAVAVGVSRSLVDMLGQALQAVGRSQDAAGGSADVSSSAAGHNVPGAQPCAGASRIPGNATEDEGQEGRHGMLGAGGLQGLAAVVGALQGVNKLLTGQQSNVPGALRDAELLAERLSSWASLQG